MKRLSYYFKTENHFDRPVARHSFALRCLPREDVTQTVPSAALLLEPDTPYLQRLDAFGNSLQVGQLIAPHDSFTYIALGEVEVDHSQRGQEVPHPMYRYASPMTILSDEMKEWLGALHLHGKPIEQAEALMGEVHALFRYVPHVTTVRTTAAEAFAARHGVCQDYAQVLLALLRALGIPARYACGLSVGEGATHAWVEASLENRWMGLDPTRCHWVNEDYVTFAVGRDAGDCPVDRAVFYGGAAQTQTVFMRLMEQ